MWAEFLWSQLHLNALEGILVNKIIFLILFINWLNIKKKQVLYNNWHIVGIGLLLYPHFALLNIVIIVKFIWEICKNSVSLFNRKLLNDEKNIRNILLPKKEFQAV